MSEIAGARAAPIPVLVHCDDAAMAAGLHEMLLRAGFATRACATLVELSPMLAAIPDSLAVLQPCAETFHWLRRAPAADAERVLMLGAEETWELPELLRAQHTAMLQRRQAPAHAPTALAPVPVAAPRRGHILIVDDEPEVREILATRLQMAGFSCALASNGLEALAAIEERLPDVALLDLGMPGMDGMDFLRAARAHVKRDFGVIVLTGSSGSRLKEKVTAHGAFTMLSKPVDFALLLHLIEIQLDHNATRERLRLEQEPG